MKVDFRCISVGVGGVPSPSCWDRIQENWTVNTATAALRGYLPNEGWSVSGSCVFLESAFATNDSSFGAQMYWRVVSLLGFVSESVLVFFFHFVLQPSVEIFACRWNKDGEPGAKPSPGEMCVF